MVTLPNLLSWVNAPRIDNFGTLDPLCSKTPNKCYWKPDTNIQIPGYTPIGAILPGTITSVQQTGFGQTVVTVKLDNPLNSLATHTFYEHMSSAAVHVGEHVSQGQLIGYNNPPGQVPLGFGLYSGDVYGSGTAWATLQNDLKPGGAGLLNPVGLINDIKSGKTPAGTGTSVGGSSGTSSTGGVDVGSSIMSALGLPTAADVQSFAQRMGLIFVGGMLLLIGLGVLFLRSDVGKESVKAAAA